MPSATSGAAVDRAERSALTELLLDAARATDDDLLRAELLGDVVVVNRRVAEAVAMRYRDRGVELEDLQQAAYEGLVKAVRAYDPALAKNLLTYAVPTIRGEVRRHFRDRSWMVRPPRRVQELQARIRDAVDDLQRELGREPTSPEVRTQVGISEQEHADVAGATGCFRPTSLDQEAGGPGGRATLGDLLGGGEDGLAAVEARCMLAGVVGDLAPRDQELVYLRFVEQRTQREIGDELGMSQVRVSRALSRVLAGMRARIEGPEAPLATRP